MTPEEKTQVLGTIEKLMNLYARVCFEQRSPDVSRMNIITNLGRAFAVDYPCVVWHWEGEKVVVTDFIQKEV